MQSNKERNPNRSNVAISLEVRQKEMKMVVNISKKSEYQR